MHKINTNQHCHANVIFPAHACAVDGNFFLLECVLRAAEKEPEKTQLVHEHGPRVVFANIDALRVIHCKNTIIAQHNVHYTNICQFPGMRGQHTDSVHSWLEMQEKIITKMFQATGNTQ